MWRTCIFEYTRALGEISTLTKHDEDDDHEGSTMSNSVESDLKDEKDRTPLLTLIRHPETVANVHHVLQGATDSPWTVQGQQQAERLASAIGKANKDEDDKRRRTMKPIEWNVTEQDTVDVVRARGSVASSPLLQAGRPPTHLFTSPLGRTKALAKKIREVLLDNVEVVERDGLAERNFGPGEGKVYGRRATSTAAFVDTAEVAKMQAESSTSFYQRVRQEAEFIRSMLLSEGGTKDAAPHIVIITHGLWIRSFLTIALGSGVRMPFTDNTGIFTLGLLDPATQRNAAQTNDRPRYFGLISQNDTSHLVGLKRQRGGIGSSASDSRQQTLKQLWSAKKDNIDDDDIVESKRPKH